MDSIKGVAIQTSARRIDFLMALAGRQELCSLRDNELLLELDRMIQADAERGSRLADHIVRNHGSVATELTNWVIDLSADSSERLLATNILAVISSSPVVARAVVPIRVKDEHGEDQIKTISLHQFFLDAASHLTDSRKPLKR